MRDKYTEIIKTYQHSSLLTILENDVAKRGWKACWNDLKNALKSFYGKKWFALRRILLNLFDAYQLRGYDKSIPRLLDRLPDLYDLNELSALFDKRIHNAIIRQFRQKRSTHFFSLEELEFSRSNIIVQDLLFAWRGEFIEFLTQLNRKGLFNKEEDSFWVREYSEGEYARRIISSLDRGSSYLFRDEKKRFADKILQFAKEIGIETSEFMDIQTKDVESGESKEETSFTKFCRNLSQIHSSSSRPPLSELTKIGFFDSECVVEQYNQQPSEDFDGTYYFPDIGRVSLSYMQSSIVPAALQEIARSNLPDRTQILLDSLETMNQFEEWNEDRDYSLHEAVFNALKEYEDVDSDFVVEWIKNIHWDFEAQGCNDVYTWMSTSAEALDTAFEIAFKHGRREVIPDLEQFLPLLDWVSPWGYGEGLSGMAIKWLVKFEGINLFDKLIGEIRWHHRKWDCGSCTDVRIVGAIVEMGKDVIPKLAGYRYEEWGLNEGVIAVYEGLGKDPGEYYCVFDVTENYDYWTMIIDLKAKRSREKALDELMRAMIICEFNGIAKKKWVKNLNLDLHESDIINAIHKGDVEISRGACILAEVFPSEQIKNEIIKKAESKKAHAESILYSLKHNDPVDITLLLKWIGDKFTPKGFDCESSGGRYESVIYVIDKIVKRIASHPSKINQIKSGLKSKVWQKRAAAITLLFELIKYKDESDIVVESDLSEFEQGFVLSTKSFHEENNYRGRYLSNENFAQIIIESAIHCSLNDIGKTITDEQLIDAITQSENPIPLIEYIKECPTYSHILKESLAAYNRILQYLDTLSDNRGFWQYMNDAYDFAPKNQMCKTIMKFHKMILKNHDYWTLHRIGEEIKRMDFREELLIKLKPLKQLEKADEHPAEFVHFISSITDIPSFNKNEWLRNQIAKFIGRMPEVISKMDDEYRLSHLKKEIESCDYIENTKSLVDQIDIRIEQLPRPRSRLLRPPSYTPPPEPTISERLNQFVVSFGTEPFRSKDYEVRKITDTKDDDAILKLNAVLADYLKVHRPTLEHMKTVVAIPVQFRTNALIESLLGRVDDISEMIISSDRWWEIFRSIFDIRSLVEHPKIAEAIFDKWIQEKEPLKLISMYKRDSRLFKQILRNFRRISLERIQIDSEDWTIPFLSDSEDILMMVSRDSRIINNIVQSIRASERNRNPLSQLIDYPHLFSSKTIRSIVLSKVEHYIPLLEAKETDKEVIETVLRTTPLMEEIRIVESLRIGLKQKTESVYDPVKFSGIIQSLRQYSSEFVIDQFRDILKEYLDIEYEENQGYW